uniref:Uncharacterized protein n=1 Tax=Ananas comosus var. bracteatus TaxID=296719 RepID=A0A6V7P4K8_ANACO|nr:unnamed protein product [Ananas comosus var. bracteatus]
MIVLLCDLVFAAKASKLECFGAAGDPWYESVSSGHLVGPDGVPVWFSGLPVSYGNRFWETDYGDPVWGFVSLVLWVSGLDTDLVDLLRSGRLVRTQCSDATVTGGCFELHDLVTALGGIHDTGSVWPPIGGVLIRIGRPAGRMDQVGAVSDSYASWFSTPRGSCGCDPVVSLVRRANTKETLPEWTEELCICGGILGGGKAQEVKRGASHLGSELLGRKAWPFSPRAIHPRSASVDLSKGVFGPLDLTSWSDGVTSRDPPLWSNSSAPIDHGMDRVFPVHLRRRNSTSQEVPNRNKFHILNA